MSQTGTSRKWNHLGKVLRRNGPFVQADFDSSQCFETLNDMRILVIGAGGLGCELLKCLAMMGFVDLHVIDCDTIDLSNLNRQFLFRTKDIGRSKAAVAAEFINRRVAGCHVIAHDHKIEDMDHDFYSQFNLIVVGLDAIEPRKWLNRTIFQLLEPAANRNDDDNFENNNRNSENNDQMTNVIPIVDGGTEGFKGNARVIIPGQPDYPCIECTLDLYPPRVTFPMCTLAQRPRLPEHCIEYVRLINWPASKPFGDAEVDGDDAAHLAWIHERAIERAKEFAIDGVTFRLTQGVVKHIIPAVASTNAVIASACVTEVFKLVTGSAPSLKNYFVFNDSHGVYTYTYAAERKPDCSVCGNLPVNFAASGAITLQQFLSLLCERFDFETNLSVSITAMTENGPVMLFMPSPIKTRSSNDDDNNGDDNREEARSLFAENLSKSLEELRLRDGQRLAVSDRKKSKILILRFV